MKNFKFLRIVYWILLIGIPAWIFVSYLYKHESYPALVDGGVATLDKYNIFSGEVIPLEGEWEFYPGEILVPGDDFSGKEKIFLQVPMFWEKTDEVPRYGCGTYRCIVNTRNTPNYLALYYNGIFTSSAIYINGLLYDVQGQAGETKSSTFPELKTQVVPFPSSGNSTEIIIPVSNFYFRSGGIQGELLFGEEHAVAKFIDQRFYIKAFLIGGLIIIAFFQLGMAVLPRFNRMYYLFAATCALLAFRLLVVRESPLYAIQDIPYEVKLRLEYLTLFLGIPMISAILNALFPKDFHKGFVFVFGGLGVLFSIVQYFVDILTASWMIPIYQIIVFIQGLIVTVILVVVVLRKRPDSYVFFIGWMMVLAGLVHDILETSGFLHHDIQITPYLMFLFVFAQANVVALRSAKAFIQVEDLSDRLNFVNLNLEKLVSERTRRIEKQSMEMERQSRKIDRQNKELQKTVEIRNQVLTIIGHDLRGPIGNIGEMIDLLLSADIDGETQEQVLVAMRQAATGSFTLLENLMYWGRAQSGKIAYNPERHSIRNIAGEAMNLLESIAKEKNINLENYIPPDHYAWCDHTHVNLIIRNLVNNAIKFTRPGGHVMVSSRYRTSVPGTPDILEVMVRDDGIGIPPEKLEQIFSTDKVESTWGTNNEKGSGIGLQLVKQFVSINKGQIYARSSVGEFTTFFFSLPSVETR